MEGSCLKRPVMGMHPGTTTQRSPGMKKPFAMERAMKRNFRLWILSMAAAILVVFSGCGTIYKAARDERSLGTFVDDESIEAKIKGRLFDDDQVKGFDISVYCFRGEVFLVGLVEQEAQRVRAVELAKGVAGVKSVTTYILDKGKDRTTGKSLDDVTVTAKVKATLIGDKDLKSTQIDVKTVKGHVVLLGIVSTQGEIQRAIAHAKQVEGVQKIKSFVMIR